MKKLKLLFIVNVDWFFISHRLPIALAALDKGYEVHLATTITEFENKLRSKGLIVHPITFKRYGFNPLILINSFIQILFLYFRIKPNLVHLVTIQPVILGSIAAKFQSSISVVAAISGLGFAFSSKGIYADIRRYIVTNIYRFAFTKKKICVIFQNQTDMKTIIHNTGLEKSKVVLIKGSGVDLKKYKETPVPKENNIVLFAGRLLKTKGLNEFLYAASCLNKKAKFVVAGKLDLENKDSIAEEELYESVKKKHIKYIGNNKNMESIISNSSIVCLPSYYGEGLPLILIEAASSGRPIVTTDHPGCRDAIIDGVSGFLVPIKDGDALTKTISLLLDNYDLMKKMGKNARNFAEKNFDISLVINKHLEIYSNLSK